MEEKVKQVKENKNKGVRESKILGWEINRDRSKNQEPDLANKGDATRLHGELHRTERSGE